MKTSISLSELTKTFRDAVAIARRLQIRYLWVDSLCILQDSQSDWLVESAIMDKVYIHAFCTIAATTAYNGNDGCYSERDPRAFTPIIVDTNWTPIFASWHFVPTAYWEKKFEASPLVRRGWVTQERLLSKRTLHFADVLIWECPSLVASEIQPFGVTNSAGIVPPNGLKAGMRRVLAAHEGEGERWRADKEMKLVKHLSTIDNITSPRQS
jgi:hypothetical protein